MSECVSFLGRGVYEELLIHFCWCGHLRDVPGSFPR